MKENVTVCPSCLFPAILPEFLVWVFSNSVTYLLTFVVRFFHKICCYVSIVLANLFGVVWRCWSGNRKDICKTTLKQPPQNILCWTRVLGDSKRRMIQQQQKAKLALTLTLSQHTTAYGMHCTGHRRRNRGSRGSTCSPNKVIGGASNTSCSPNFSVGLLFSNILDDITYIAVILWSWLA